MIKYLILFLATCFTFSCKKYLDKKPDIKLAIPNSAKDYQLLLDQSSILEGAAPQVGDISCDDYYLPATVYTGLNDKARNCYIWAKDIWAGRSGDEWSGLYYRIYNVNVVIDGLDSYSPEAIEQSAWNNAYSQALFLRALFHYSLEEVFGQPYKPSSANTDLGIPLKLTSNLADLAKRSTVKETYDQILTDLNQSLAMAPTATVVRSRPSKAAVFALLARVHLTMQDYNKALHYADSSISYINILKNYVVSEISSINSATAPFSAWTAPNDNNSEVLFPYYQTSYQVFTSTSTLIDTMLYASYESNDRRKTVFFRTANAAYPGRFAFKGHYSGSTARQFSGLAVNEMYLIKAECQARAGNKDAAIATLSTLMQKRWNGTWSYTPVDAEDALRKVLEERRKELLYRGLRWIDLRRLNQDPRFAKTLKRILNGVEYTLPPNDPRYTFPIPDDEIRLSGLQQNPR